MNCSRRPPFHLAWKGIPLTFVTISLATSAWGQPSEGAVAAPLPDARPHEQVETEPPPADTKSDQATATQEPGEDSIAPSSTSEVRPLSPTGEAEGPAGTETKHSAEPSTTPEPSKRAIPRQDPTPNMQSRERAKAPPPPEIDYSKLPLTYHQMRIDLGAAFKESWIPDSGFDLFSRDNSQPTFQAHAAVAVFAHGPLSYAVTLHYDTFSSDFSARTSLTHLAFHRALLGAEARYHISSRLYGFGRVNAGPALIWSRLGSDDDPSRLELSTVGFSAAITAGGAVRVLGSHDGRVRALRAYLFAEGGLAFVSNTNLNYEVSDGGALRAAPLELGAMSLSSPQIAVGGMVSF